SKLGEKTLAHLEPLMRAAPMAAGQSLVALDFHLARPREIVIVPAEGPAAEESAEAILQAVRQRFLPGTVVAKAPPGGGDRKVTALFEGRKPTRGETTVFVCEGATCREPVHGLDRFLRVLE